MRVCFRNITSRSKNIISCFIILLLSSLLIIPSVLAISDDQLDMFAENNILFYDPEESFGPGQFDPCQSGGSISAGVSGGGCNILGNSFEERLWSALRGSGFSPEQSAGLIGNILHEGGSPVLQEFVYNDARSSGCLTQQGRPYHLHEDFTTHGVRHGGCIGVYGPGSEVAGVGVGFIQWTAHNRREGYLKVINSAGLGKYIEGNAYQRYGRMSDSELRQAIVKETGSDNDYKALWCASIKYLKTELERDYKAFFTQPKDPSAYAAWIASKYEVCSGCQPGQQQYNLRTGDAKRIYNDYKAGKFAQVEGGSSPNTSNISGTPDAPGTTGEASASSGAGVTIIGDSITNGSKSALLSALPGVDIHAQDSKQFAIDVSGNPSGLTILKNLKSSNSLRPTVIFALGTNDSGLRSDQIQSVVASAGSGHTIFFVTNYDAKSPAKYQSNNQLLTAAAQGIYGNNVRVIDWASTAKTAHANDPVLLDEGSYIIHPNEKGKTLFAKTLASAIGDSKPTIDCNSFASSSGGVPGSLNITTAADALKYLQKYITDTNKRYGRRYRVPAQATLNQALNTPLDDTAVSPDCWGGTYCGQCTALSGWFVTQFTKYTYGKGNGSQVTNNMVGANPGKLKVTNTPTPFSVFSWGGSAVGHTGIVLGDLGNGTYLYIHNNSLGPTSYQLQVSTGTADYFRRQGATFVDLKGGLK